MPVLRDTPQKSPQRPRRRGSRRKPRRRSPFSGLITFFKVVLAAGIACFVIDYLFIPEEKVVVEAGCNQAELAAAAKAGHDAGVAVANTRENTMAREKAILDIRARETAIRRAGFEAAADTFAAAAQTALHEVGVF